MKSLPAFLLILFFPFLLMAQNGELKGTVKDVSSGELLIGANVVALIDSTPGKGTVTDINGNYSLKLEDGEYIINISYIGYVPQTQKVKIAGKPVVLDLNMETKTLKSVEVTADVAIDRETPVAFTNISSKKIDEELGNQDLPMLLNSTPGVYATQQGGGFGDSRITIRGFDQRNIAVMIDGIPQNDMENGAVYWSDWDGLGDVLRTIQIQRGLGASKLAISSVGGTMNFLTKGVEAYPAVSYKQEVGNDGFLKEMLAMTTGKMKGGWGITVAGARKTGDGWADETWVSSWNYFAKVEKTTGKHLTSLEFNAAPQKHAQRAYTDPIVAFDTVYAKKLFNGDSANYINVKGTHPYGIKYNPNWGYLDRFTLNGTDTIHNYQKFADHVNYFNQPQIALKDFWSISNKLYWSNSIYYSYGVGGTASPSQTFNISSKTGQDSIQPYYVANAYGKYAIDPAFSTTERKTSYFIKSAVNEHYWTGLLSSIGYDISNHLKFVGGVDLRNYQGVHYNQVYDLLGADYMIDRADQNKSDSAVKHLGDKFGYYYNSTINWEGLFGQLEYKKNNWSTFVTFTGSEIEYKRVDNYKLPTDSTKTTPFKTFPGYTIKGGANYNINKNNNVFLNMGYITKAPPFSNVWNSSNLEVLEAKDQIIKTIELGYGAKYKQFAANINAYYTDWLNKPLDFPGTVVINGDSYSYNVNGLEAIHKGVELDLVYAILHNLRVEAVASLGDFRWNSKDTAYVHDPTTDSVIKKIGFDAKGVHVGNAAQTQLVGSIRYEVIKGLFIKPQIIYYAKNYADFDPTTLNSSNAYYKTHPEHDSWEMPSYYLVSLHAGYEFRFHKFKFEFALHINNLLNTEYITDASNNEVAPYTFDAKSAWVFFGVGRAYATSLKVTFL